MLNLNWDNISILVVDDNTFMRNLIVSTVRMLGINNVVSKSSATGAIEALRESRRNPAAAGFGTIDIILSDFVMEEVDGALFLRWVRTSKQAPDRFVPFVMVSGAADQKIVEAARDAGANGFQILTNVVIPLSKPGIMIGSIFIVTLVMGDFITVRFMSGSQKANVGRLISNDIALLQYPSAAATAVILLITVLLVIAILLRFVDIRKEL